MKGVIFNVVQEVVEDAFGIDFWDDAVDLAGIEGSYTSLGSYEDGDMIALVGAIAELARVSRNDVLVLAGRHGFSRLASRHTELLEGVAGWRDVLDQLDGIIHPEVRKIYPDADDVVLLEYESKRNLCGLAEGLVKGLGDWFESELSVTHLSCVHRGDDKCHMEVAEA